MKLPHLGGLWRHGDFLRLWTGQTIAQFGSQITLLALPLAAALLLGASPLEMGVLSAAGMAPFLLIGLPAGVWVDRRTRRPILVASDLGRALALATIPVAYLLDSLTMMQLYLVGFVTGVCTVFFDVAYMSYLPALVGRGQLVEGNSKMEVTRGTAMIAGPGLAGWLVQALTAPIAIAFNSVSFLVSALFLWRIRARETAVHVSAGTHASIRVEIGEGLRYVFGHPLLRPIAATTATANLFSAAVWAIYVLFAVRELALEPSTLGVIFAIGNVGVLFGAVGAGPVARRFGLGPTIIGSTLSLGLATLLIPLATPATAVPLLIVAGFVSTLATPIYNINQVSLRQAITPDRLQGRMNATMRFLVWGTLPIGSLLGGLVAEYLGLRTALAIAASGQLCAFLWVLFSPVRALREQPVLAES